MTAEMVPPDERALRRHLDSGRFLTGVQAGRWRLITLQWPYSTFAVAAAPRVTAAGAIAPSEYVIRLEVAGYPNVAPTGSLWDLTTQAVPTSARPRGNRAEEIFRLDWENGTAMYAAWDRVTLAKHGPEWGRNYPRSVWHPQRDLTFILEYVYEVLNADDYLGI